jgi:hypothetical protein
MSDPLPPVEPAGEQTQENVVVAVAPSRVQNPGAALVLLVVAVFFVVAAMLAVFQLNSQNSFSSIRNEQNASQVARDQLAQVICTLWRSAPPASRSSRPPGQVAELDRLCAILLPVSPAPSPSKG